jgi:hypothetical protein
MSNGTFDRRGACAVRRQRRPLALGRAPQSTARSTSSLARPGQRRAFMDRKPNQIQSTADLPRKRAGRPHLHQDSRTSAPGLHTSAPGLAHICAGNRARIPGTATHTAKPSRAGDTATNAPRCAALLHVALCCTNQPAAFHTRTVLSTDAVTIRPARSNRRFQIGRVWPLNVFTAAPPCFGHPCEGRARGSRVLHSACRVYVALYARRQVSMALDPSAQHHRARVRQCARVRAQCALIQWIGFNAAALPIAHLDRAVA